MQGSHSDIPIGSFYDFGTSPLQGDVVVISLLCHVILFSVRLLLVSMPCARIHFGAHFASHSFLNQMDNCRVTVMLTLIQELDVEPD